jgi:hypothetical protein
MTLKIGAVYRNVEDSSLWELNRVQGSRVYINLYNTLPMYSIKRVSLKTFKEKYIFDNIYNILYK